MFFNLTRIPNDHYFPVGYDQKWQQVTSTAKMAQWQPTKHKTNCNKIRKAAGNKRAGPKRRTRTPKEPANWARKVSKKHCHRWRSRVAEGLPSRQLCHHCWPSWPCRYGHVGHDSDQPSGGHCVADWTVWMTGRPQFSVLGPSSFVLRPAASGHSHERHRHGQRSIRIGSHPRVPASPRLNGNVNWIIFDGAGMPRIACANWTFGKVPAQLECHRSAHVPL